MFNHIVYRYRNRLLGPAGGKLFFRSRLPANLDFDISDFDPDFDLDAPCSGLVDRPIAI
jgi:hypothetical protein